MFIEALMAGGLVYATQAKFRKRNKLVKIIQPLPTSHKTSEQKHKLAVSEREVNRKLQVSVASTALSATGSVFYPPLALLSIPGLIYSGSDIFKSAYYALIKEKKVNTDTTIAVLIIACIAKDYLFICNLNTLLAMTSRKLLFKVKDDSQHNIIDVFKQQPQQAWLLHEGVEMAKPVETLRSGDIIVVNAGETIPADGYICAGAGLIDQHILTGESQPAEKSVDDKVFALTLVLSGRLEIRVESAGEQTTAAQIGKILNQTTNLKTDMQLWTEKVGDKAVLPLMLLSGASMPLLGASGALAVLNSHPKYKTTITSYIGVLNFLSMAARQGILVKDGRIFELLGKVDTVVFDKTGTLTENKMQVNAIHVCENFNQDAVLSLAATAETKQTHPIARAILQAAEIRQLPEETAIDTEYRIGHGLLVKTNNVLIRVGSIRFMESEGVSVPPHILQTQEACRYQGHSLVLVAVDNQVAGAIELDPVIREEATAIIQGLRQRNIDAIYILSGDHDIPTKRLAMRLGTDHYFAEVLPNGKAEIIEKLQSEGRTVCFIGDGINDSIALKTADVSISLRGASSVATDTAQVILMDESLNKLCHLFELADEYKVNMKQTFGAVLIPHALGLSGALLLHFGLFYSVILNQAGLFLGAGNAILPRLRQRQVNEVQ